VSEKVFMIDSWQLWASEQKISKLHWLTM